MSGIAIAKSFRNSENCDPLAANGQPAQSHKRVELYLSLCKYRIG